jgi:hypothetical protein
MGWGLGGIGVFNIAAMINNIMCVSKGNITWQKESSNEFLQESFQHQRTKADTGSMFQMRQGLADRPGGNDGIWSRRIFDYEQSTL